MHIAAANENSYRSLARHRCCVLISLYSEYCQAPHKPSGWDPHCSPVESFKTVRKNGNKDLRAH